MTTNILLALIAVLLLARIVLQVWQGKSKTKKVYSTICEIENTCHLWVPEESVWDTIRKRGVDGFELVQVMYKKGEVCPYALFFTRKKIKNYYDGKQ